MILFEKDWEQFPTAILDTAAPNDSFLKYALLLKEQGVKNYRWPLVLIHSELLHVNPFDPNLSVEQKILVAMECKINPWYFFRRVARATGSTADLPIYFKANRSNMALYWMFFNHITVCLEQLRQTGKTFGCSSLDNYLLNIRSAGGRTLLLTKDESLRAKTLTEIKTLADLIPGYLKMHHKTDIGNREEINVSALDNNYKALVARNDPIAADKTGRGHTVENIRVDEAAYLFWIEIAMRVMLAATTAARRTAEIRDNPFGNIFTTTSGKKDDRDGAYMYKYFHDAAPWTEFFMDAANQEELRAAVKSSSRDGKVLRCHMVFSHRQLGYTDEWLRETAAENNSYGEAFERDYLNIWTSGSQNSPFDIDTTKRIRASEMEVQFADISRFGQIVTRWYKKEDDLHRLMQNDHTVVGVDTSDAMGKDEFTILVRHLKTGETLGVASINEINLITVADFLVDFLIRFPKSTMIVERRNQAATIIDSMHQKMVSIGMNPFRRMFNFCVQNYLEEPDRYKEIQEERNALDIQFLAQNKKYFGFTTSSQGVTSRSELYGTTMNQAIKYTASDIRDKRTVDQILALIIRDGRIDHPKGGHDDHVIVWLLTYWFMVFGKNLQFYGIPDNYILTKNEIIHSVASREERMQADLTKRATNHINYLMETVKNERDPNVVDRIIFEIENVKNILGPQSQAAISINDMITQLRKNKSARFYTKRSIYD